MADQTLHEFLRPLLKGSRREICLGAMYFLQERNTGYPCTAFNLKSELVSARIPGAKNFNVADVLGKAGHFVSAQKSVSKVNEWSLTDSGRDHIREALGIEPDPAVAEVQNEISILSGLVAGAVDEVVREYLKESVLAYQVGALRAAVVFLWSGAIRTLQNKALASGAPALNAAISKHDPKARHVSKVEDFSGVKDVTQLLAFRELGLVDKGEWATLQEGLDLRNRCGHPTKYKPGLKKASAFIEDVVGIVF